MQWKNNTTAKEVYLTPFQFHSDARERTIYFGYRGQDGV